MLRTGQYAQDVCPTSLTPLDLLDIPLLLQNVLVVAPTNPLSTKEKVQIKVTSKEDRSFSDWPPLSRGPPKGFPKGMQKELHKGADKGKFWVKGFPLHLLAPLLPIFLPLAPLKLVSVSTPSCSLHVWPPLSSLHFSACCQRGCLRRCLCRAIRAVSELGKNCCDGPLTFVH